MHQKTHLLSSCVYRYSAGSRIGTCLTATACQDRQGRGSGSCASGWAYIYNIYISNLFYNIDLSNNCLMFSPTIHPIFQASASAASFYWTSRGPSLRFAYTFLNPLTLPRPTCGFVSPCPRKIFEQPPELHLRPEPRLPLLPDHLRGRHIHRGEVRGEYGRKKALTKSTIVIH